MSIYNHTIDQIRTSFGKHLKHLRTTRKMTQASLKAATGVTETLISAFEHGERAVGPSVAEKLADGLQLAGQEREDFLIGAASTRRRDRLASYARHLPAEVLNYVPRMLSSVGVDLDRVQSASIGPAEDTVDAQFGDRLDQEYARIKAAMVGGDRQDVLDVHTRNQRYLCALLAVPSR